MLTNDIVSFEQLGPGNIISRAMHLFAIINLIIGTDQHDQTV